MCFPMAAALVRVKKPSCHGKSTWFVLYDFRWSYACRFWHFQCVWAFFFSHAVVFTPISDDICSMMRKESFVCMLRFRFRVLNRCFKGTGWFILLVTLCTHTCAHTNTQSLMVSLRPGQSHMEQTVMRKRITVFHQQLSPAAPVSVKSTYIASGHAVAKEVLVSKQELAGKHPQSWFKRLDAAEVDFKLHTFFIYVY